jgi:AMMECR1 domain-containing protein
LQYKEDLRYEDRKTFTEMKKQQELFSVDDMYGCIGIKDELYAVAVAAYLWAIRLVSELDDDKFRKVKKECDAVKIGGEEYFVSSVPGSMNIYKLNA